MTATGYNDTFKWVINKDTLGHIVSSTQREQFVSDKFEIGEITWQLIGYPMYDTGTFHLYLRPMNISNLWNKIIVAGTLYCTETICGDASIFVYNKKDLFRAHHWSPGCLSLNEIENRNLYSLTLSVNVQILEIIDINNNNIYQHISNISNINNLFQKQMFKWQLNNITLTEMKQSLYGKCFISFVNALFCLKIFPNGYQKEGQVHIELQWFGIPGVINNKILNWNIKIPQANICTKGVNRFSYDISSVHWGSNILSLEKFKTFDSLVIYCEIDSSNNNSSNNKPTTPTTQVQTCTTNENILLKQQYNNYVTYKQFNASMNKMYEEIRNIQNVININYENTHNCLSELKNQIIELNKHQMYNDNEINKIWNKINNNYKNNNIINDNIQTETSKQNIVKIWLTRKIKLAQYYKVFIENGYDDMDIIKDMNENDLQIIGINKIGHRKKILKSLHNYNNIHINNNNNDVSTPKSTISNKSDSRKQEKINKILKIKKISDNNNKNGNKNEKNKIKNWLYETVKLPQYFELFVVNGYDTFESIYDITFNELADMGINKMGHRKKIIKYSTKLIKEKFLFPIKKCSTASPNSHISQISNGSNSSLSIYSNNKNIWSDDSNKNNS